MKIPSLIITISLLILSTGCKTDNKPKNLDSPNPFDTSQVNSQSLTEADRAVLAHASGKIVKEISTDSLAQLIKSSSGQLHLYCFWNLLSEGSITTVKAVKEVSDKTGNKLKVVYVNMPNTRQAIGDVNLFIREQQLVGETYILDKAETSFLSKKIKTELKGITTFPFILLAQSSENIFVLYNRPFEAGELSAILQAYL
jgi:hypothetical protein